MRKSSVGINFVALNLLAGSTWLADALYSSSWPTLLRLCFHDAVVCLALIVICRASGTAPLTAFRLNLAIWGGVLFAAPPIVFAAAAGAVRSSTELLALGLIPAFTVFVIAQRPGGDLGRMGSAVAGVGGLALAVPSTMPGSFGGYGWLGVIVAAAALAALAGVRLHASVEERQVIPAAIAATAGAALLSLAGWFILQRAPSDVHWRTLAAETAWSVLIDLPLVLLTFTLVHKMRPEAFSTRFLLVPLITILGGIVALRPILPWTTWLGLALVAGSSWTLCRECGAEGPPSVI